MCEASWSWLPVPESSIGVSLSIVIVWTQEEGTFAVSVDIMETRMGRKERLVQAVGGLRQKGFDLRQQLASMETEIASMESEIASIDAVSDSERRVMHWIYSMTSIGRRNVTKMGSHRNPHWDLHAPMNAALWSTLPIEIQQLVFARLPWLDIIRLRCLSKQWNRFVSSETSEFMRLCTEFNPRIFAMINRIQEGCGGTISVRMYDIKRYRWHHFIDRVVQDDDFSWTMCAGDGGLVCVVTPPGRDNVKKRPLLITVCNPLTRQQVKLPSHGLCSVRPRMVQLVMDRERRFYKVIVVGKKDEVAQIYSSETKSWSSATASADVVFGHGFEWLCGSEYLYERLLGPCVYDCAESQLVKLKDSSSPWTTASVESYASVGDRLFVLHKERHTHENQVLRMHEDEVRYCISEYRGQKEKPYWVNVTVHRCEEFEEPPLSEHYWMQLRACKDFLIVFVENGESGVYRHELTWLYDLSTGIWQAISRIPEDNEPLENDTMCELRWDAIP